MQIEEAQDVLAWAMARRQLQALPNPLPGIRNSGLQGKPGFIVVPQVKRACPSQGTGAQLRELRLGRAKLRFIAPRPAYCDASASKRSPPY